MVVNSQIPAPATYLREARSNQQKAISRNATARTSLAAGTSRIRPTSISSLPSTTNLKREQIDLGDQSRQTSRILTASLILCAMKSGCIQEKQPLPYRRHIVDVLEPRDAKSGGFEGYLKTLIVEKHPGWLERRGKEEWIWDNSPYRGIYMDELAGNEKDTAVVKVKRWWGFDAIA
jgi:hypothetical protein